MVRVLIVANEPGTGPDILGRLAADPVIEVAGITHSLKDALDLSRVLTVDLLFVPADLWLGAGRRIRAKYQSRTPAPPVVVFTQTESGPEVTAVLQAGAILLCPLNVDEKRLCEIIKRYASTPNSLSHLPGQPAGIPNIDQRQFEVGSRPETFGFVAQRTQFDLTESDRKVLRMLIAGMSNADIQDLLGISARSLENLLTSIRRKLRLLKESSLAQFAAVNDVTTDPPSGHWRTDLAVDVEREEQPGAGDDVLVVIVDPVCARQKAIALRAGPNADIQEPIEFKMITDAFAAGSAHQFDVMIFGTTADETLDGSFASRIREHLGNIPLIAVADLATNNLLLFAVETGVANFVDSNAYRVELDRSTRRVTNGEQPINEHESKAPWTNSTGPSESERTILCGFRDGITDAEIRLALGVGRWTFWQLRTTMLYRLALDNPANAVRVAIQRGWIEPSPAPEQSVHP